MATTGKQKIVHVHLNKADTYKTTLSAGNHELVADEPLIVKGGTDQGPDPYDYLLMSLGSCTAMTVKMYADHKKWELDDVFVELRHNKRHKEDCLDCDNPKARIDFIEKEIILKGNLDEKQRQRLLEISERCPVNKTLKGEIEVLSFLG